MKHQWILIANSSIARLFSRDALNDPLIPVATMSHPQSRARTAELAGDRPGREATDNSSGANRYEPHTDLRRKEHQHFAREICERLDKGLADGEFGALFVFASNPFLGELKAHIGEALGKHVKMAIDRDLSSMGLAEIEEHLRDLQSVHR